MKKTSGLVPATLKTAAAWKAEAQRLATELELVRQRVAAAEQRAQHAEQNARDAWRYFRELRGRRHGLL